MSMYDDMQTSMNTKAGFNGNISVEAKTWSLSGDANKGLKVADMGKFLMENNLGDEWSWFTISIRIIIWKWFFYTINSINVIVIDRIEICANVQ